MGQLVDEVGLIVDGARVARLLGAWAEYAERDWYEIPGKAEWGCYGAGYGSWGVQTNQKYVGAMAALWAYSGNQKALDRALAGLRFSMASHKSGSGTCTDGSKWGHGWISVLGIERMMHGVHLLEAHMTDADKAALEAMITGEANWLLTEYPVVANVWNASRQNKPESNLWNGCLLWRAGAMYPGHANAAAWQEKAVKFLVNAVSVASDAQSEAVVDGKKVKDLHVGANFFPHYVLDHHGYMNLGYMVICASNAGILHFDLKSRGLKAPEALKHHQADLWAVIRKMVFQDGRLARIGGDTRVRYAYCQEYLLTALMYAQDELGERHGGELAAGLLKIMETEAAHNDRAGFAGSFYGERLAYLRGENPYYHTRLESDRASVLGFALTHRVKKAQAAPESFEKTVAGGWIEPEHGAALHRGPKRLASFSWRAKTMMQGMCQPPDDGHLSDWDFNMAGLVEAAHHHTGKPLEAKRKLLADGVWDFEGGFGTIGAVVESEGAALMEGWGSPCGVRHALAFVALADGRTVVGLQLSRAPGHRTLIRQAYGLGMALANDLFNGFERRLRTSDGGVARTAPSRDGSALRLGKWVDVEGKVGLVALRKGDELSVMGSPTRQGGMYKSLYVERIMVQHQNAAGWKWFDAGATILDTAWAAVSGPSKEELARFVEGTRDVEMAGENSRVARVRGLDGREHVVKVEFGERVLGLVYQIDSETVLDRTVEISDSAKAGPATG